MKFFTKIAKEGDKKKPGQPVPATHGTGTNTPGEPLPATTGDVAPGPGSPLTTTAPPTPSGDGGGTDGSTNWLGAGEGEGYFPGDQSWLTNPIKNTLNTIGESNLYNSFSNIFDNVTSTIKGDGVEGGSPGTIAGPADEMPNKLQPGIQPDSTPGEQVPDKPTSTPDSAVPGVPNIEGNTPISGNTTVEGNTTVDNNQGFGSKTEDAKNNNVFQNMDKPEPAAGGGWNLGGWANKAIDYVKDNPVEAGANVLTGGMYEGVKSGINFLNDISKKKKNESKPPVNESDNNPNNVETYDI